MKRFSPFHFRKLGIKSSISLQDAQGRTYRRFVKGATCHRKINAFVMENRDDRRAAPRYDEEFMGVKRRGIARVLLRKPSRGEERRAAPLRAVDHSPRARAALGHGALRRAVIGGWPALQHGCGMATGEGRPSSPPAPYLNASGPQLSS
jgi:hypothetical protein